MPELARDEDDVQALGDQERGERVAERVQGELPRRLQSCAFEGLAEAFADVAVVEPAADRVAEDEVDRRFVRRGEPVLAVSLQWKHVRYHSRFHTHAPDARQVGMRRRELPALSSSTGATGPTGAQGPTGATGATGPATLLVGGSAGSKLIKPGPAYGAFGTFVATNATEGSVSVPVPAGTAAKLTVSISAAPGAGRQWTFTVRRSGSDTTVTCTISNPNTTCSDTTNTAAFTAAQTIDLGIVASGNPSDATATCSITYG